jgi:hypothetical protein
MKKRRSVRSYSDEPISQETVDKIADYLSELSAPDESIDWNFDTLPYMDMVKLGVREPGVKAPYYLVLRSEKKPFCLQNCGYLGSMAMLYMTELGLKSCWMANFEISKDFPDSLPYIIAIAFGYSDEPFRTVDAEPNRNPVEKSATGAVSKYRDILDLARYAPSAGNRQPLSYQVLDGRIHIFRKHVFMKFPPVSYLQCIDAGIGIAYITAAAKELGYETTFLKTEPAPTWGNKIYQATVQLSRPEA